MLEFPVGRLEITRLYILLSSFILSIFLPLVLSGFCTEKHIVQHARDVLLTTTTTIIIIITELYSVWTLDISVCDYCIYLSVCPFFFRVVFC